MKILNKNMEWRWDISVESMESMESVDRVYRY